MDQLDCGEQNKQHLKSVPNLQSSFGNNCTVNDFLAQIAAMKTTEEICWGSPALENTSLKDFEELNLSDEPLNQLGDHSPSQGMSSALRSVALMQTWDVKKFQPTPPKLVSAVGVQEVNAASTQDKDKSDEGEADPQVPDDSFQSKYIDIFPLYQDYCLQEVRDDLHRLKESFVSDLINHQYLRNLQSRFNPHDQTEVISPKDGHLRVTLSTPPPQPVKVTPSTLWQDLEEVKTSGLLSRLTPREIRLQESMFELIGSEASYLRSLRVAVRHFYASKALKQTLTQREHHILFSNIRHVTAASEKFLMDLEIHLGESVFLCQVGNIVLKHSQGFRRLYVPYVTNMMYQEALITQQLQRNKNFMCSLKKLESDPGCQRQTLKSFLVLPFQRITRIKLLLETILRLSEPDSDSFRNLEKAKDAIHEIVAECDRGVQKMKQIEELVCLEMLLDFGKVKSIPLITSSRFLVHQGPVKQLTVENSYNSRTSFISHYLHLFNDLLIISSKKDQQFLVEDYAEYPTHVTVESLKTKILGLPPHSFLLHLSVSQTGQPTAMILVPQTKLEKDKWMKALSTE